MTRLNALTAIDLPQAGSFIYRLIWHDRSHRDAAYSWLRKAVGVGIADRAATQGTASRERLLSGDLMSIWSDDIGR